MDQFDKLLPLLILGMLAAILLVLVRRAARDKPTPNVREDVPKLVVAAERVPSKSCTAPSVEFPRVVTVPVVEPKPRRTRPASPPAPAAPPTTIEAALTLLNDQQSLATAFLLREIFAPPVSRQARLPRDR